MEHANLDHILQVVIGAKDLAPSVPEVTNRDFLLMNPV
uniref:Uncharacterized protein n=1 Tax=Pseudomonas aeruginosa TaxID=287 RepID=A0A5P9WBD3_PSEAI|nr:hypothetical protein PNK5461_c0072 [Pseudomonas aeruginosa]